jgi:glycosyltransferase involved in cell wall biosynthesis
MPTLPSYVLITPARNEEAVIELTIKSMVAQTVKPLRWVIVSDGSTDRTEEIVKSYLSANPWIELLRMPERRERHFAGKVRAFEAGLAKLNDVNYEIIGSLDGDISFDSEYFGFLLRRLAEDPQLGLVGTPFMEANRIYDYRFTSIEHVSGACQLFRRECFEQIGGYVPVRGGGIDLIAVLTARMKGWKTRTFTDKVSQHHREMGTAQASLLLAWFKNGVKDYALGCHPVWEAFRTCYQMTKRPYVLGGLLLGIGYAWSSIRHVDRTIPKDVMAFRRREQTQRLKNFLIGPRVLNDEILRTQRSAREPEQKIV